MPDQEAETVAKSFFTHYISRFGVPRALVTDNGANFTSQLLKEICKLLQIRKMTTSPYHPQANGGLERSHRPLAEFLRCVVGENSDSWDEWLPHAMHVYNSVHSATRVTPMKALYGFDLELPTNVKRKPNPVYNHDDYSKVLKFQLQKVHEFVRKNQIREKEKAKQYYDKGAKCKEFCVGEKVWLKKQARKNKLAPLWEGPFEVVGAPTGVNVRLRIRGKEKVYHKNLVKKHCEVSSEKTNGTGAYSAEILAINTLANPRHVQCVEKLVDSIVNEGWGRIDSEFRELRRVKANGTCSVGNLPENRRRNRYTKVACYDQNLVSVPSGYINASYVSGSRGLKEFIITQGPLSGCQGRRVIFGQ